MQCNVIQCSQAQATSSAVWPNDHQLLGRGRSICHMLLLHLRLPSLLRPIPFSCPGPEMTGSPILSHAKPSRPSPKNAKSHHTICIPMLAYDKSPLPYPSGRVSVKDKKRKGRNDWDISQLREEHSAVDDLALFVDKFEVIELTPTPNRLILC